MRRSMIAVLAAVALSASAVTAAMAAPHGGGGGGGGGHMGGGGGGHIGGFGGGGHIGGFGGGGIARGGIGAGAGVYSPMRSAAPNIAASPAYGGRGNVYAWRGGRDHDFDHDRGRHRGFFFGPGYSGLYSYQPYCNTGWPYEYNYNSCYDSDWN